MTYIRQFRQTIKGTVSFTSAGVHSGKSTTITLTGASAGTGIEFIKSSTQGYISIQTNYTCVIDTKLCTKISNKNGNYISTIEHIMSALFACGIDDVKIIINGDEVPIMDGSAKDFTDRILGVGITQSTTPLQYIKIIKNISFNQGDSTITISPYDGFKIDAEINFDKANIGTQHYQFDFSNDNYQQDIAPARTFGFKSDVDYLHANGFALGGGLHNAVIFDNNGTSQKLRFENECIRHKILDIIGDLSLAQKPLLCLVTAKRMGHHTNNNLLHRLFADKSAFEIV